VQGLLRPREEVAVNMHPAILVPIDGSTAALRAMSLALVQAKRNPEVRLHLLNVQSPALHPWPGRLVPPDVIDEELRRRGQDQLEKARGMAEGSGVMPRLHVRIGHPAEEIVACATEEHCEQIVMGTRGMGAAAALALGSVAGKVVHLARMPVTLVK
jgi:nucleotide-binding universal stress UspA family protein